MIIFRVTLSCTYKWTIGDISESINNTAVVVGSAEAIENIEYVIEMLQKNVHLTNLMIVLSQRLRRCIIPSEMPAA